MRFLRKFRLDIGLLGAAHAGARRIAALRHEAGDDAVEDDAVVEALVGEAFDALDMAGGEIVAQPDDDVAAAVEGKSEVLVGQVYAPVMGRRHR